MIEWHSMKKDTPKLKKMRKGEGDGMTSDRLLVLISDSAMSASAKTSHIGFGSYKVFHHETARGISVHSFWSVEGHGGSWPVTHWAEITFPKGVKQRQW